MSTDMDVASIRRLTLLIIVSSVLPALGLGQTCDKLNPADNTVCAVLNGAFTKFWTTCGLTYPVSLTKVSDLEKKVNSQVKTSANSVPDVLWADLNADHLTNSAQIPSNLDVSRLLVQTFTAKNLGALEINSYISDRANQAAPSLQQTGVNATVFTTSCGAALAVALDSSTGFTLPIVSLKAALNATAQASAKSTIIFATGRFDSPMAQLNSKPSNRLYGLMLFFKWRLDQAVTDRDAYYLAHAHGAVFNQVAASQFALNAGLSGKFGSSSPFVSADLSASVTKDITTAYDATSFTGAIDTPVAGDFAEIPKSPALKDQIAAYPLPSPANTVNTVFSSDPDAGIHISQPVRGIPVDVCGGKWDVQDANSSLQNWTAQSVRAAVSTPAVPDPDGVPTCVIDFDIVKGMGTDTKIVATPQLKGTIVGAQNSDSFLLTLSQLHLSTDPYPALSGGGPSQKWSSESDGHLPYQISLQLQQEPSGPGYDQVSLVGNYVALCANKRTIKLFPSQASAITVSKNNTSSLTLPLFYDETSEDALGSLDLSDSNPMVCTIESGQIQLTDTSSAKGNPIPKQLQSALALKLRFPHVKPTVTLTVRNCANNKCDMVATFSGVVDSTILTGKTVTLSDANKPLMSAQIDTGSQAAFAAVPVSSGTHSFVASIVGDADLSVATSNPLNQPIVSSTPQGQ